MSRPDDEDRDEGFLGRWARRKKEAQKTGRSREGEALPLPPARGGEGLGMGGRKAGHAFPSSEASSGAAPHPTLPTASGGRAEHDPVQPEPEMVEPPSLDLIDKDFDLAHWLKQNVPEEWKLKALRRAWESDPMISSYLDPARDYALDWNTPGGAPGYGPLSESDNVEEMLANIFGKPPEPAAEQGEAVRNDVAVVRPSSNEGGGADSAAPQQGLAKAPDDPQPVRPGDEGVSRKYAEKAAESNGIPAAGSAAMQKEPEIHPPQQRARRRGGGATPL